MAHLKCFRQTEWAADDNNGAEQKVNASEFKAYDGKHDGDSSNISSLKQTLGPAQWRKIINLRGFRKRALA